MHLCAVHLLNATVIWMDLHQSSKCYIFVLFYTELYQNRLIQYMVTFCYRHLPNWREQLLLLFYFYFISFYLIFLLLLLAGWYIYMRKQCRNCSHCSAFDNIWLFLQSRETGTSNKTFLIKLRLFIYPYFHRYNETSRRHNLFSA